MVDGSDTISPTVDDILTALQDVKDPEIPLISVVDLGIITKVEIDEVRRGVSVTMTPTFVGCPALDHMRREILARVRQMPFDTVDVNVDYTTPWSSNRVSDRGREALHKHGLALPMRFEGEFEPEIMLNAECPFCGSSNTRLVSPFGPTLCRALYTCTACSQGFEQFKPV
ncbi:MAG: 1,2-phenylacetyl-CoA epoxidase subunit PaaD [Candidatus Kapaibacterium sp.]